MNIENTKKVLTIALKRKITPMVWGRHGIGKSEIIKQLASDLAEQNKLQFTTSPDDFDDKHFGFVDLRLGQMEVGDLIGMPVPDDKLKKTIWYKPIWFPVNSNSRGILFLDELNRARTDTLQAVFQLVWDRRLATHVLPQDWGIIIACNPSGSDYFVNELDPALMDRFLHIKLTPETKEWLDYSKNSGKIGNEITDFIAIYPEMLGQEQVEIPIQIKPSPRSWELVGRILKDLPENLILEVCGNGLVGMESALPFIKHIKKNLEKPVRAEEILNHYNKAQEKIKKFSETGKNSRIDFLRLSCDDLIRVLKKKVKESKYLTDKQEENFIQFLRDLPSDLSFSVVRHLINDMETDIYKEMLCKYDDLHNRFEKVAEI